MRLRTGRQLAANAGMVSGVAMLLSSTVLSGPSAIRAASFVRIGGASPGAKERPFPLASTHGLFLSGSSSVMVATHEGDSSSLTVWDAASGSLSAVLLQPPEPDVISALAASPDGDSIYWASGNYGCVSRLSKGVLTEKLYCDFRGSALAPTNPIERLELSQDGTSLLVGSSMGPSLIDAKTGELVSPKPKTISFLPSFDSLGRAIYFQRQRRPGVPRHEARVEARDLVSGEVLWRAPTKGSSLWPVAVAPRSRRYLLSGNSEILVTLDLESGSLGREFRVPPSKWGLDSSRVAFSPDEEIVALAVDQRVLFFELASGKQIGAIDDPKVRGAPGRWDPWMFRWITWSDDGSRLATGDHDGSSIVFSLEQEEPDSHQKPGWLSDE